MLPAGHEGVRVLALDGRVAVVTGGASGIGAALARRFTAEGATVVTLDRQLPAPPHPAPHRDAAGPGAAGASPGADASGGSGAGPVEGAERTPDVRLVDVTDEAAVAAAVAAIEDEVGPIDLWCSNAGLATSPGLGSDADWDVSWRVHVLAHLYAARHVLPRMRARGHGTFLVTASAAGLLAEADVAAYSVTKHAAVALAEWLAIEYGGPGPDGAPGIDVHCLCPQGVRTPLLAGVGAADSVTVAAAPLLEPDQVAQDVLEALADKRFLILPHPEVAGYEQRRAADRDRWLASMRGLKRRVHGGRTGRTEREKQI